MKLYWSRPSPFVRKVMVVAHEAGVADRLTIEETTVTMVGGEPGVVALQLRWSQIPTLVLDDGSTLHDSRVICEYLDTLGEGQSAFPGRRRCALGRAEAAGARPTACSRFWSCGGRSG